MWLQLVRIAFYSMIPVRLTQFVQCSGFDLTYPLPRHRKLLSNLLQRLGTTVVQPKPHTNHRLLPRIQRTDEPSDIILKHSILRHLPRLLFGIAQRILNGKGTLAPSLRPSRPRAGSLGLPTTQFLLHRDGPDRCPLEEFNFVGLDPHLGSELLLGGIPPQFVLQVAFRFSEDAQLIVNVDGEANGTCLIGNGAHDPLFDPPGGVGGEAESLLGVEFLAGAREAEGALLA
mmetsp:Transcript_3206/g.5839  ORF Transcript_3206/g.5839 Transcript_3206/m.5839 type:complete len:230 (+) Transcript_3206:153-842(+)